MSLGLSHKNLLSEPKKKPMHTLLYIFVYSSCWEKTLTSIFHGGGKTTLEKSSGSLYAEFPSRNLESQRSRRPGLQGSGPGVLKRSSEGSHFTWIGQLHVGHRHSSPQPRELIRVWACFSSDRRTWNLSAERDIATGWAGASGAVATSSCRCTMGSSTDRSRLELRM